MHATRPPVRLCTARVQGRCRRLCRSVELIGSSVRAEAPFSGHECARYCRGEVALKFKFDVKKTKLTSNFGEETENVCISVNVCVSFCFSGSESEGARAVFHIHNRAKSQSRVPKVLQCLEHLYAGLRIMMNICARFALLPAGARHDRTRRIGTLLKFGLNQPTPQRIFND